MGGGRLFKSGFTYFCFMSEEVTVDGSISAGLGETEEAVLEVIALNPDLGSEGIRDRYSLSRERIVEVVDSLQGSGLVRPLESGEMDELVWEVTRLGRLRLLKCVQIMRFEVMEAKLRGCSSEKVERLEEKKNFFKTGYKQCKVLFE